jgi:hypothetical protein
LKLYVLLAQTLEEENIRKKLLLTSRDDLHAEQKNMGVKSGIFVYCWQIIKHEARSKLTVISALNLFQLKSFFLLLMNSLKSEIRDEFTCSLARELQFIGN